MRRFLAFSLAILSLGACSGGGDDPPTQPTVGSISLSVSTTSLTIARGSTATTNITVGRTNFTGAVTFSASGVPSGVVVNFAPSSLSGTASSSVASVDVSASAAPGNYTITLSAAGSGVASANGAIVLTIPSPAITLTAGSTTSSVVQGQTSTVPLTITRTSGYTDAVTLSATGQPTGVTVTFAPTSIASGATTSTASFAVAATVAPGSYPITITGAGTGVTAQNATVTLTVTSAQTPSVSITSAPAALNVEAGQTGASTLTITRGGGFTGAVGVALLNAPAGITAAFNPASIATGSTTSAATFSVAANVAPGLYNLSVQATGAGVTAATTAIALTVTAAPSISITTIANQSLSQGTSSATGIAIVLVRTGTVGNATLTLEGAPTGVTAAFSANPAGASSLMTLTAAANAAPGTYALTVRATAGTITGTTSFSLTVSAAAAGSFAISVVPTTASVVQGQTTLATVNIARAGGFTGGVTLTATGLPTGVTATFTPTIATGTQSQLGLNVGAGVAPGLYTITVRGTGAGVTDQTATLALTVTQAGGGGGGNTAWTFCDPNRFPLWFAVQNGTSGAWVPVTPTGTTTRIYSFSVSSVGGVAFAITAQGRTGVDVSVFYMNQAEMGSSGVQECTNVNRGNKSLAGTVANLGTGGSAIVNYGGATGVFNGTSYNITNGPNGTTDLLAVRSAINFQTFSITPDRAVLRRNVNYVGSIPVIDFTATESFAVTSAPYTFGNLNGDQVLVSTLFETANGNAGSFAFSLPGASPVTVYGVPSSLTQAGDLHGVLASAFAGSNPNASSIRLMYQYNRDIAPRTLTFGGAAPTPTITSSTTPYVRYNTTGSWSSEYGDALGLTFYQTSTTSNTWTFSMTRAYTSSAGTYTLATPDFTGVGGFNSAWAMGTGSTSWSFTTIGPVTGLNQTTGRFTEGANWKAASRTGIITP